jgi:hypothetical protein
VPIHHLAADNWREKPITTPKILTRARGAGDLVKFRENMRPIFPMPAPAAVPYVRYRTDRGRYRAYAALALCNNMDGAAQKRARA